MRRRTDGFTLIELLVVIAIIAILAAIMFPVMLRAKRSVTRASCASNLKQIGEALKMYARDYQGFWPEMDNPCPSKEFPGCGRYDLNSWADCLIRTKYVSSRNVFICPAARTPSRNVADWNDQALWDASPVGLGNNYARAAAWGFVPYQYSYAANYWLMGTNQLKVDENWSVPVSRTIWIAEGNWSWFQCQYETANGKWRSSDWYTLSMIDWRHPEPTSPGKPPADGGQGTLDGANNFLLLDGHVAWLGKYVKLATDNPQKKGFYINPPGADPIGLPQAGDFLKWYGAE